MMILIFLLCAGLCVGWLPWWSILPLSFVFGAVAQWRWIEIFSAAILVAALQVIIPLIIDWQNHGLISHKMAGLLGWPPAAIFAVAPLVSLWLILFPAHVGGVLAAHFSRPKASRGR